MDHIRKVYKTLCNIHIIENKFNTAKQLFNTFDDELNKLIAKYKETNNVLDAQQIALWAKMALDAKIKYIKEKCNYEVTLITARNILGVYSHDTKLANKLICKQKRILDEECTDADAYYKEISITYLHPS